MTQLQRWLRVDATHKPMIFTQIYGTAELRSFSYWSEIVFSVGIATFGLGLNSPAVIIGAMLTTLPETHDRLRHRTQGGMELHPRGRRCRP